MSALLTVSQLTKSFGTRRAVDGVSFTVHRGQTVGLLGPNGAGKSTTVAMICGLLTPDSGSVTLDGESVSAGASAAKRKIGFVPQDLALYDDLSALENLKLFAALYGLSGARARERAQDVLALVNLTDRAKDKPATFSGGMKRRLNIAAALMHDPQLLILDEPTVGVDPQSRNAIFETLERLKGMGRSLIYTSHYMEEVERLADHIVIIDHGKVLADDTPAGLFRKLPAHAALSIETDEPVGESLMAAIRARGGVTDVALVGDGLTVKLAQSADALPLMTWLAEQGVKPRYFATARTSLEDIFLNLTGRTLRD
ncbi:ABC transporter ATP-binding protein [Massilia arenosa]|uniref:ABC transporter ATP-binding protein n=1 Tax=Zemynaea arenosa TaxID=2561931 RepID=A0A4Y9S456_9BURK|nr:ABC transporter ATP-binding protein [Massilia arenosa]TFW16211.1 ABC transporter ATP-binding protein [Massilia arenosa]